MLNRKQAFFNTACPYYMHNAHGDVVDITNGYTYSNNCYIYNAFGSNEYFDNTDSVGMRDQWGYCYQLKDYETGNYYMRIMEC